MCVCGVVFCALLPGLWFRFFDEFNFLAVPASQIGVAALLHTLIGEGR